MYWSDGACYDGEWIDNKAYGFGIFYHSDGDIFQGYWANDKTNGIGVYLHSKARTELSTRVSGSKTSKTG